MKFLIILCIALSPLTSLMGQRSLTSVDANDLSISSTFANGDEILKYTLSDGSVIEKGSELYFGSSINGMREYTRIVFGYYSTAKALMSSPVMMPVSWAGTKLVVDELKVYHYKMSKNSEVRVLAYVKDPAISSGLGGNNRTILDLEMAISTGEVINPKARMTREQAIVKLKESKDLLDLGLMTLEEYEKLKSELTPIIVGNK